MGAEAFISTTSHKDPQIGFRELQESARAEFGNDPYNGTISTVSSFRQSPRYRCPVPRNCLDLLSARVWDERNGDLIPEIQKWESCLAVPLAEPGEFEWKEETFTVEVNEVHHFGMSTWEAMREVGRRLPENDLAGGIETVRLTPERDKKINERQDGELRSIGFAVVILKEKGPRIGGAYSGQIFSTREKAEESARRMASGRSERHMVVELTATGFSCQQENDPDLYRITYQVPKSPSAPQISGWAFIGLAAC